MLLLVALFTTTVTIVILRITFGYLWRPLRPPQSGPPFWRVLMRAAATVAIRRLRARWTHRSSPTNEQNKSSHRTRLGPM
ncbi:MAG: hypothetical protein JO015_03305 [Verrucomicrobia bacterium]|nr:hypothetical protein [Verrucomicrobiota bacterium]